MENLLNPTYVLEQFGYIGLFIIVTLESGFIFGFFLPGDSLLFTAGLLASQGYLNLPTLIVVVIIGAIIGNNIGYYTGRKLGPALFSRPDSFLFSQKRVAQAHEFFQKRGGRALIIVRFVSVVRTFVPIIAGVAHMPYRTFLIYNAIGAVAWGVSIPLLGFLLGETVPGIDRYLVPIIALLVLLSASPLLFEYLRVRRERKTTKPDPKP